MKMAFWNCTLGATSSDNKKKIFKDWVSDQKPDLLILEEVSQKLLNGSTSAIGSEIEAFTSLRQLEYANTLDKNDGPTTKCIVALANNKIDFQAKYLSFPELEAKRGLLKVIHSGGLTIWAIHANASKSGGEAAVNAVAKHLAKNERCGVGGDYNFAIADALAKGLPAKLPHSHQNSDLTFTQWNGKGNSALSAAALATCHLFPQARYANITLKPNAVLDYIASGSKVTVTPSANCKSEAIWWDILTNFDHCPVVYDVK
jgi:hypothetical protein